MNRRAGRGGLDFSSVVKLFADAADGGGRTGGA
jgi:hypothetical protein